MKTLRIEGTLTGSVAGAKTRRIKGRSFVYLSRVHSGLFCAQNDGKGGQGLSGATSGQGVRS